MRLVAASLQPRELDDLAAAPSVRSFVPKVRIGLAASPEQAARVVAANQDIAGSGQVGGARIFASLIKRDARIGTGGIDRAAL
jgi:nitrogen regulatory protein PII